MKHLIILLTVLLSSCSLFEKEKEEEIVVQIEDSVHSHDLEPHTHPELESRITKLESQDLSGDITSEEGRRIIDLINNSSPFQIKP